MGYKKTPPQQGLGPRPEGSHVGGTCTCSALPTPGAGHLFCSHMTILNASSTYISKVGLPHLPVSSAPLPNFHVYPPGVQAHARPCAHP